MRASSGDNTCAPCLHPVDPSLQIGEDEEALKVLIDAHELELAIALCTLVPRPNFFTSSMITIT